MFELVLAGFTLPVLQRGLCPQLRQGLVLHAGHARIGVQATQLGECMDAVPTQAFNLHLAHIGDAIQVVLIFPLCGTTFAPVAETASVTLFGHGGWPLIEESVEALPKAPVIMQVVANARTTLGVIAEHKMHFLWLAFLIRCQEFGIMGKLDHELRRGAVGHLGVGHFVAPCS